MSWMTTASDAIFDALCALFRLDPRSDESFSRFRDANTDQVTYPQAKRTDNICYYTITNEASPSNAWTSQQVIGEQIHVTTDIPISCLFTFYGPNADTDAEYLWSMFNVDTGFGSPRSILRMAGIVPVPSDTERVVVSPELDGALWRRRCDVRCRFAMHNVQIINVNTLNEPPDIHVRH